ncbi:MAG TPA: peptidase S41, partial [Archangium sp.]|nr:peptidase S41 [Archangium sp.]
DIDSVSTGEELDDQMDAESQDEVKEDFEVQFARDYVLQMPYADRRQMLQKGKDFVEKKRTEEEQRINSAIHALNVDWSSGATPKDVKLAATFTPAADQRIAAGETFDLTLTAENQGAEPLKRVRAWTESDNYYLDRREFLIGSLAPGEKKTWKVKVKLPKDLTSRRDEVKVKFFDDNGALPTTLASELNFAELPRPAFSFNWQVIDNCESCNRDGQAQRGEDITLVMDVTNSGKGKALDSFAQIKNLGDPDIFIEKGRFKIGELAPGETKTARFQLTVKKGYDGKTFPLRLAIVDEPLEEFAMEKLELPVSEGAVAKFEPKKGLVKVAEKAELLASPDAGAPVVARLSRPAVLNTDGVTKGFYRVELDKDRFAFVSTEAARDTKGKATAPQGLTYVARRSPPEIKLDVDLAQGGLVANGEKYTLSGEVDDAQGLLDMYVLVNDQKVYFQGVDTKAKAGEPQKLKFSTEFSLKEGNNSVLVVARESTDFASRRTLVIRRRPAEVAQKVAPASATKPPKSATP